MKMIKISIFLMFGVIGSSKRKNWSDLSDSLLWTIFQ